MLLHIEDLKIYIINQWINFGGKIDFVLHSIGMSVNVGKERSIMNKIMIGLRREWMFLLCLFIKPCKLLGILDALNEWGSIIGLSYIAAQRVFHTYNDMADNKAVLESIARSFGYHYGLRKRLE